MKILEKSTPISPLLFFESLFKDSGLKKFKEKFYLGDEFFPIESNLKGGYIEIRVNVASDSELYDMSSEVQKIYYDDKLKHVLNQELQISKNIINERLRELAFQNMKHDLYLEKQLQILTQLNKNLNKLTDNRIEVKISLDKIEEFLLTISKNNKTTINTVDKKNNFFDLKKNVNKPLLKKLYIIAINNYIIDIDIFKEDEFIQFFLSSNPKSENLKFLFNCNNQLASIFLKEISFLFNLFEFSQISNSESFINKGKKILNINDLNKAFSLSNKNSSTSFLNKSIKLKKEISELKLT